MKIIKISEGPCTKFHYGKQQVYQYTFRFSENTTIDDSTEIIQKLIKSLTKNYNRLEYNINIKFNIESWRMSNGGAFVNVDDIDLPDAYNLQSLYLAKHDTFNTFSIFARKPIVYAGGSDIHNDCLYNAIIQAHNFDKNLLPKKINKPWKLKTFLGLERDDLISIDKIQLLEEILKCSFTVSGDCNYISPTMKTKNIALRLAHEHYKLICNKGSKITFRSKNVDENNIYTIKYGDHISIYDGDSIKVIGSNEQYQELYKSWNHLLVKIGLNEDHETKRREYLEQANYFKNHKFINFFKFKSIQEITYNNIMFLTKSLVTPEEITPIEGDILNKSFGGGLHYAVKGEFNNVFSYDINSMYAYFLSNGKFLFPVKQPNFKTYTTNEILNFRCFPFGLYHCNIIGEHPLFKNKNKYQWWSHHDLNRFKLLNLTFEMAEGINHLEYDRTKLINGSVLKKYIYDLYKERKTNEKYEPVIKSFITTIWGTLTKKNRKTIRQREPFNAEGVFLEKVILQEESEFTMVDAENIFKYDWARILFITSFCRLKITQIILDNFDISDILQINTDGFLSTKQSPNINVSPDIGAFKCKQYAKVIIQNSNDVKFF
jgi:hypothetical protein